MAVPTATSEPGIMVVSHPDGAERLHLKFTYTEPSLNFERVFNMDRSASEPMSVLSTRITSNVSKFLSRKAAKKAKKKSAADAPPPPPPDDSLVAPPVSVLLDGQPLPADVSCLEALVTRGERTRLWIGGRPYRLNVNPPTVVSLTLPSQPMAGYPVRPAQLELAFAEPAATRLCWRREAGDAWQPVGEGAAYVPVAADVGRRLQLECTPVAGHRSGQPQTVQSEPVQAGPGPCPFQQRHAFTPRLADRASYRVISYNLLADLYADSDFTRTVLHPYCPPYALHIDYRSQLFVSELIGYNGDIVCLQEVDYKIFDGHLVPRLREAGLEGEYTHKGQTVAEGLACFYRTDKLRLVSKDRIVLGEEVSRDTLFADVEGACRASPLLRERLIKRTQTLQVTVLESTVAPHGLLVVANTHLYFHPNADHIRALQIGMCMRLLERTVERLRTEYPGREVALLFCGDFNSCPDFSVLRLMRTQRLDEGLADFSSKEGEEVQGVSFQQPYLMETACGTPDYTNYVGKFFGCLDYIFYMTDKMKVLQVVPLPSHEEVVRHTALPSVVFPSDHLALVADLAWL